MNRHSIGTSITLFFVFLALVINLLFFFQYRLEADYQRNLTMKQFNESLKVLRDSHERGLSRAEGHRRLFDLLGVTAVKKEDAAAWMQQPLLFDGNAIRLYDCGSLYCFILNDRERGVEVFLTYPKKETDYTQFLLMLFVNLALLAFYLYVLKKLRPLKRLKDGILEFSQGNLSVSTAAQGKDEIAEVSNAFDRTIRQIAQLQESRNLFLRNIMHELKTPITKGKLSVDLMEETKYKERFAKLFDRLDFLLGEFAKIERITSGTLLLNQKRYRVIDILDNAIDILMAERDDFELVVAENVQIEADYAYISIAIKNLLDNALKYGKSKPKITVDKKGVVIASVGQPVEGVDFNRIFNRAFEDSSKGLGLGLYITNSIVQKHGFKLIYRYENGINYFTILFA